MRVHVERQIVDLMKRLIAYGTFVLFFSGMRQFVVLIIALLVESLSTDFTVPGFIVLVDTHMSI